MKEKFLRPYILCLLLLLFLSGCSNKQKNYFDSGVYSNGEYELIVTSIDYETFKNNKGINVVEDRSKNRKSQYYEIILYKLDNENKLECTFKDLKLSTVTTAEPCSYKDSNGNGIAPQIIQGKIFYGILFDNEIINIGG